MTVRRWKNILKSSIGSGGAVVDEIAEFLSTRPVPGTYFEPFVSSGTMFFELKEAGLIGRAVLSSSMAPYVETLKALRDRVDDVSTALQALTSGRMDRDVY